jgi:HPt (histidine-containing phosphotransfer) domain-containing protein
MTISRTKAVHIADKAAEDHDLSSLGVRELVALLSKIEDELRQTPVMVRRHGVMAVNPDVAPLLARQRAVAAQLRQRRLSWHGHPSNRRQSSASWPIPPWI